MKTPNIIYALVFIALFNSNQFTLHAQGIYQLWGTTYSGGPDDKGVLFSTKNDGSGYTLQKTFTVTNPGRADNFNKPEVYSNSLYCGMSEGGLNDDGIIAEYNTLSNTWIKRADLYTIGGRFLEGSLTLYNNKLYGVCDYGGNGDEGILFEFNPANNVLTKLHDFDSITGSYPREGLTVYNSKLYGMTSGGGSANEGVVYEFNPATNVYTKKANILASNIGVISYGTKLVVYNNLLWGASNSGAMNDKGAIFSYNPLTNALLKKVDLQTIGTGTIYGSLTLLNNKLYGNTNYGGASNTGVIFEYNPATNLLGIEYDLSYTSAKLHMNFTAYNNLLYSCSTVGGAYNLGQIFSFNPVNNQYTALYSLQSPAGINGAGAVTVYNNKLWGFTQHGSTYNEGSLFSYNLLTSIYTTAIALGGSDLQNPGGPLLYYNNKIYGTCQNGGIVSNSDQGAGGIYEFDPATNMFTVKVNMLDTNADTYDNGGFTLLNNKFYGVSSYGGNNNEGSLYVYDPATNLVSKLHDFAFATGSRPFSALSVYNGKLYGTCKDGSSNGVGNLFEYNPVTNVYSQKVVLDNSKGTLAYGQLTWYNNKFYGVCFGGGTHYGGTIFEYNPAINSYIKKIDLDSASGDHPFGALTEWNGKLYGMTMFGGSVDSGTIFEYNPLINIFSKKVDLNASKGVQPMGRLTLMNNKFYSMTQGRGSSNCGTLFQYDPAINSYAVKYNFTPTTGKRARSNELIQIPALTAPGSSNSCNNTQTINITAANSTQWITFTDAQGRAVAEINANGNILGNTAVRFYVNAGNVRQDANGTYYLDRNITITPTNQPASNVSVRLYIRKSEFDDLKATAGSGVNVLSDIQLVKNIDFCATDLNAATSPCTSTPASWATDYVFSSDVNSLGSFYFMGQVAPSVSVLNLKVFIQDYYESANFMKPVLINQGEGIGLNVTDSIDVELHNAVPPYNMVSAVKTLLNTNGSAVCNFSFLNGMYYIVVRHRNAIQTWSANPVNIGAIPVSYDFSIAASQAYGNNLVSVENGVWAMYSGDVNQDENIDLIDLGIVEQDISNFLFGYLASDINGDGNVDLLDSPTMEANINAFIYSNHP